MKSHFDINTLDSLIHGRIRLGIIAYLASVKAASFAELKSKMEVSDGNLSTHLRKLEEAGYVCIKKTFKGRKPHTSASLSAMGRAAWIQYLEKMQALLSAQSAL